MMLRIDNLIYFVGAMALVSIALAIVCGLADWLFEDKEI
jgi:hypothetical protein